MNGNYSNRNRYYSSIHRPSFRSPSNRRRKRKRTRNRLLIILIALLLLGAIAAGIYFGAQAMFGADSKAEPTEPTQAVNATVATASEAEPTTEPATEPTTEAPYQQSKIKDNNSAGETVEGVYIWNKAAFEAFEGKESDAVNYANAMSIFKNKLGDTITLYNMVVPTHIEFGLPQRLKESEIETNSQAEFLKKVYSSYGADVKEINCYNILSQKANEYTYFTTDDTWTGLGAYYAYTAFMNQTEQTPVALDKCTKKTIDTFRGVFANQLSESTLWDNPDKIEYYTVPNKVTAQVKESNSGSLKDTTVFNADTDQDDVFIHGSNPLFVIKSDCNTGRKIALVKEYYGNAFGPYLAANYDEVHIIDYRKWSGNLKTYCNENNIQEVLFLNSIQFAADKSKVEIMKTIFA